ncbi:AAA family ATPase [Gordonia sp. VNQ95]|uniref:AAA family ATPase n=1 Tax=Gordonia sp. VNQ95 TaxID=3156619 RepID=UPI0032B44BE1
MRDTAYERILDAFREQGLIVDDQGGRANCQAPGHSPKDRSVVVTRTEGSVLVHSHSEPTDDVLVELGFPGGRRDPGLYDDPRGIGYEYPDGRLVRRSPDKKFRQAGNTKGRSLYRADRIAAAEVVYYVEGEKDVHAVESAGGTAVCNAQGAGKVHLADLSPLKGKTVMVVADKDETGRKHATQVVAALETIAADVVIVEAAQGKDAADHVAAGRDLSELVIVEQRPGLSVVCLADVTPERVSWLWPGRIPAGKLVTLDGDPSLGKSTLSLSLAATITTGGLWPDDTRCEHPGAVVLLSAEDGLADTVRPRADAAGADVTMIHAVQGVPLSDGTLVPPTLADIHELTKLVRRVKARLLVVDVLMAYLPTGTDSHKDQDVRRVLSRLSAMADETGCTVLLLRHLNKAKGGDPMYRGGGSIGIVGAARAGMLVAADPDDPSVRVLASTKSNLGPPPESLRYRLVDAGTGVARVEWLGVDERDARALLASPADDEGHPEDAWLIDYLGSGPVKATEVYSAADANGYSKDQIKRSKARQNSRAGREVIRAYQPKIPGPWFWSADQGADRPTQGADSNTPLPGDPSAPWEVRGGNEGAQTHPREPREQGASDRSLVRSEPPGELKPDSPGQTDRVAAALAKARLVQVIPPDQRAALGRCHHCEWHLETQGHAPQCPNRSAS